MNSFSAKSMKLLILLAKCSAIRIIGFMIGISRMYRFFLRFVSLLFVFSISAAAFSPFYAKSFKKKEVVAVATFVSGKSYLKRSRVKKKIKINQTLFERDTIITKKGQVHIQFLDSAIVRVLENTQITIDKGLKVRNQKGDQISIRLKKGRIFNKIVKKKRSSKEGYFYRVISPSFAAGVRGTEFLISEENTVQKPKGVFVREGLVDVSPSKNTKLTFDSVSLTEKEQLLVKTNKIKYSILDDHIKKEMEIMSRLKFISRENYERLIKFKAKNKNLLEQIKERNRKLKNQR